MYAPICIKVVKNSALINLLFKNDDALGMEERVKKQSAEAELFQMTRDLLRACNSTRVHSVDVLCLGHLYNFQRKKGKLRISES